MFAGLVWVRRSPAETRAEDTKGASIGTQANYPGELLDSNSAPGQRYWALVYHSLKPSNRLAWSPWNQFISEKKHMEHMEKQGRRQYSSMELLTQMCWEDVPQIDEASLSAGPWRINKILQIRSNAFALCGGCRLASHKTYGLRNMPPNLTELISADRLLMETICQLVNEENWNLDDALHEYSNVRHDMVAVLQPRPRQSPSAAPVRGGKRQREWTPPPQRGESKGKGDRRGAEKEEGKGKGNNWFMERCEESWFLEKTAPEGQTKPICMRYNLSQCTWQTCPFAHCCPVSKSDGAMCGSTDHKRLRSSPITQNPPLRDSSQRRNCRAALGSRCPSRITTVVSQIADRPQIPIQIPRFHWACRWN